MPKKQTRISKFLSLVLRHNPGKIGIQLDPAGWTEIDTLIDALAENGLSISRQELDDVVYNSDKKRFPYSDDGQYIRANYGHSIPIDLQYEPRKPPEILFHGTARRFIDSIRHEGLTAQKRQYVHLSKDEPTAVQVGQRHGKPVILQIISGEMFQDGYKFYQSDSGIWLTKKVPIDYIRFPDQSNS